MINTAESGPELAQSGERELNSHGQHDQPHEGVIMSRADPPSLALAARETSNNWVPMSAEIVSITVVASTALVAFATC